jgi:hypothetical protein
MPSVVQVSLALPGRLPAGRMPKADDVGVPRRGVNKPLNGLELEDPSGFYKLRLWNRWSPVGNGHGPALSAEKRASADWSPGMKEIYDHDQWKANGTLTRRAQFMAPNLPAWTGRAPSFLGISGETVGNKLHSWINSARRPSWMRPGLPAAATGAAVGGVSGLLLGQLGSWMNPDAQVDSTRTGLLGALLGAAMGGVRKH